MTGIDRVEIIRGPNSLLYGQSDAGGIINYITKRPRLRTTADARGSASAAFGNYAFYRGQADVDVTLIPKTLGFRLPASFTSNEREFNFFRNKAIAYNPSLLYRPLDNTELSFEWEYLDVRTNFGAFQPIVWRPPGSTVEYVDKDNRGLGRAARGGLFGPYAKAQNKQTNWTADLTSRLTSNITFRAVYSKNARDRNDPLLRRQHPGRKPHHGLQGRSARGMDLRGVQDPHRRGLRVQQEHLFRLRLARLERRHQLARQPVHAKPRL